MAKKSKGKYYVVWVGQNPGIYDNWTDCQAQIKAFPNARYKSFKTKEEAEAAFYDSAEEHIGRSNKVKKSARIEDFRLEGSGILKKSISVDAACSGNPGVMEYRAVDTYTGQEIFHMGPYQGGTNNIGEFLALVHALAILNKNSDTVTVIYTDSRTAMSWVRNRKVKTTLKPTKHNAKVFYLLSRAEDWIKNNPVNSKIIKWDTDRWGEIPADFGRK
ncbi:MAG: viroplasmin family protein [Saprospiraceae bacterium]|jgi:ribonuclease HI